ncbi:exported hypothetical protein [Actinacidiphila bryophytorum]|uniref:Secreted protein n=1 Tax=Actinacidiphila bryophytorum TaxID=1436133 RepID=A0A9W4MJI6_9ACTN|nr:exported hypothetical protein [Actinacidiphila bryophytorum]
MMNVRIMCLLAVRTLFAMQSTGNPAPSARVLILGAVRPDTAACRGTDRIVTDAFRRSRLSRSSCS